MKSFFLLPLCGFLASAAPVSDTLAPRAGEQDTFNDVLEIIMGRKSCAPVAAIFARGTFDSGNVGVWVGPFFFDEIRAKIPNAAFQGVDSSAYKADLKGYLEFDINTPEKEESTDAALSMQRTIDQYAKTCPNSAIIVSGWSQGALVAHKAMESVSSGSLKQIAAIVTFGDPNQLFGKKALPAGFTGSFIHPCITGSVPDPLCAVIPQDYKLPKAISDITAPFKKLPSLANAGEQAAAALKLTKAFPGQLWASFGAFLKDLRPGQFQKLLLTPEHFMYGNNKMAKKSAEQVVNLSAVKKAVAIKQTTTKTTLNSEAIKAARKEFSSRLP